MKIRNPKRKQPIRHTKAGQPRPGFIDALVALRDGLLATGIPAAFIGGVAVIARGVARYTADIDATVLAPRANIDVILTSLRKHRIAPRISDAGQFARMHQVLLLRHVPSRVPLDISLAWLPFEEAAIRTARTCGFAGLKIRVVTATYLLVYKLIAHRARDIDDVERLLTIHGSRIDLNRVREVLQPLAGVLEGPDRLRTLERLLRGPGSGVVTRRKKPLGSSTKLRKR